VGVEAVGLEKIQTSTRVAFWENRANCTLLPEIVAPSGTAVAGTAARAKAAKRRAGSRKRLQRVDRVVVIGFISWNEDWKAERGGIRETGAPVSAISTFSDNHCTAGLLQRVAHGVRTSPKRSGTDFPSYMGGTSSQS
jgi:hypothetical protein